MAAQSRLCSSARPSGFPNHGIPAAAFTYSSRTRPSSLPPPRPEYVPNRIDDPNYVRIFDSTLRNWGQALGAAMTTAEKLTIAHELAQLGVDIIEAGFPAFSPEEFDAVQAISTKIGNTPVVEGGHVPVICGLSRCCKEDIDAAWAAVQHAQRPRINMFIATSNMLMECKLRKTPEQVVALAKEMVAYARGLGCNDVQFSVEDAGRSDRGFLYHVLGEVIKSGATTLNISDTAGYIFPQEFGNLISDIKANIPRIGEVIVSTHCQNYHGLATANTLAGARAGARQLELAITGMGETSRNASMAEVIRAIAYRRNQLGGLYTVINSHLVDTTSEKLKDHGGILIQPHIGTTGASAPFAHGPESHEVGRNNTVNDSDLRKKGFLSFIYALVGTLFLLHSAGMVYSYAYPGSQKALVQYDDELVKGICNAYALLWCVCPAMLGFASHFKDGESIDHVGFDIFLWFVFLWLLVLIAVWCTTLYVYLKLSSVWALCPFGVAVLFCTVLPSILYIEYQRPTIVSKWGKNMWNCCVRPLRALPGCFRQALEFCANLSCTRQVDDEKSLPSSTPAPRVNLGA